MSQPIANERLIFDAADRLLSSGSKPTVRAVRALIGGGSNRDITPALKRWWGNRRALSLPRLDSAQPDATSDNVSRSEMEARLARVAEVAAAERQHLMQETDRVRQSMRQAPDLALRRRLEQMESENLLLQAKVAALERSRR